MSHHTSARFYFAAAVAATLAACSSQVPVAPGELISADQASANAQRAGVPGVYTLSFWKWNSTTRQYDEVSSLPAPGNAVLRADVTDTLGNPATAGTVTFEYCSYGQRRYDSTQPDEAPTEACERGLARWTRLWNASVESGAGCPVLGGSVCRQWDSRFPVTIGMRFTFAQGKGTILSGKSAGRDFVWLAAQ